MSLMPSTQGGHYGENGQWVQTKRCFASCGAACDCTPPLGQHYSAAHDRSAGHWMPAAAEQSAPALPERCPWDAWRPERSV